MLPVTTVAARLSTRATRALVVAGQRQAGAGSVNAVRRKLGVSSPAAQYQAVRGIQSVAQTDRVRPTGLLFIL